MTLYELNVQMQTILEMAEDDDLDPELIAGTLECVEDDSEDKLDSYGVVRNELQMDVAKIDQEIKRLTEKKKRINANIDKMKNAVQYTMTEVLHTRKVKGEKFTWAIQKNGGKAPLIINDGVFPFNIPEQYQQVDFDFDRAEIRAALERGEELEFAHLGERGESLRLK